MTVKDRIEKLKPYFVSFNVIADEDAAYILLRFPLESRWTIPDQTALKENYKVEIAARNEGYYFMTEMCNGTDCIFDAAEYVITFNKNVEERKSLLNDKIKELTNIFATETLDNLKKLSFVIPNKEEKTVKNNKKAEKAVVKRVIKQELPKSQPTGATETYHVEQIDTKIVATNKKQNNDNDLMSLAKGLTGE